MSSIENDIYVCMYMCVCNTKLLFYIKININKTNK
jgi:hypothetical protein